MMIDSNIIVYSFNQESPKNKLAQQFLTRQKHLFFSHQNIFETLRVITHPKFEIPVPTDKALLGIKRIIELGTLLPPTTETAFISFELIKKYKIVGNEIFDAYLVATALSHNITQIATDNVKHLKKYQEIKIFNPFVIQKFSKKPEKLKHQLTISSNFDDEMSIE